MNILSKDTHQSINILAFDTSGDEASLAVWAGGAMQSISLPFGTGSHSQAACLFPVMKELLKGANLDFQDLNVIATSTGPGSFTGIRLGLATAQGLLLSTKAKSFAPTTFQIIAFGAWKERADSYLVSLTTKRDSFYTQSFDKNLAPLFPATIQTEREIQDFLRANPDLRRIDHSSTLSAENLIHFYLHGLTTNQDLSLEVSRDLSGALRPYYLHNPEFVKQKPWSL